MSFHVRLFGGASLLRGDLPLAGPASQRHRLALLALLAASRTGSVPRERLLALLWPESGADRGRHTLNVAVHSLRQVLGSEALVTSGDELRLTASLVGSDVGEFEDALARGDPARAAELYAGPFLDGFSLPGAAEFERWSEAERERLATAYAGALEALAGEAEERGDGREAAGWWKRLAAHDPYSSRVTARLMRVLAAAGDRAGALQHARTYAALLREELGVEPDAGVAALERELREPPSAAAAVPGPAGPPDQAAAAPPRPVVRADAEAAPPGPVPVPAPPLPPAAQRAPRRLLRHRRLALATFPALAAAAAAALALGAWWSVRGPAAPPPTAPAAASVAVLPFADDSRGRVNEYFTDGLADEIIGALTRVDGLSVVARTSAFAFKGRAVGTREVGEQLGVAYVLEGSVREAGDRLRVSVRLVRARDGTPVWSERFDRRMGDVLAVQDEISRAVARELRDELVHGGRAPRGARPAVDPVAYDLYLQGRFAWFQRSPQGLGRALASFTAAAERDPRYPLVHVGIADVYNVLGAFDYGLLPPDSAYPRARAAAGRALELDPTLGEAHTALANVLLNYEWSWDAAEREFRRALELSPGYATAHHWYSLFLVATGRPGESLAAISRARELDPLSTVMGTAMARHLYYTRHYARSIAEYRRVLATDSGFVTALLGLGAALEQTGEHAAAAAEYRRALLVLGGPQPVVVALLGHARGAAGDREGARQALHALDEAARTRYVPAEYRALVHLGLGENEAALRALEEAYRNRSGAMVYLNVEPMLDPLRADPLFQDLVRRVGLAPAR